MGGSAVGGMQRALPGERTSQDSRASGGAPADATLVPLGHARARSPSSSRPSTTGRAETGRRADHLSASPSPSSCRTACTSCSYVALSSLPDLCPRLSR